MGNQFSHRRRLVDAVTRFSCYESERDSEGWRESETERDRERE